MSRRHLSLIGFLVLGCHNGASTAEAPDAATPPATTSSGAQPLETIQRQPIFAHVRATRSNNATLPTRIDQAARVTAAKGSVAITALDLAAVGSSDDRGSLVFGGAATATDVVMVPRTDGYEELRVLRDARASTTMRWRLQPSEGLSLRVRERYVEAYDESGRVQLVGNPMFAVDDKGVERKLDVRLEGDTVIANLDTAGLAFPIVVDPLWTTVPNAPAGGAPNYSFITNDNRVIVGTPNGAPVPHIYNPTTNTWTTPTTLFPTGWTNTGAGGALLSTGIALFVNGNSAAAIRFNPTTHAYTATAAPPSACNGCAMTRAGDGRIVKIDRDGTGAQVYNPTTNAWATYPYGTLGATAIALTLKDGRVMTMGVLNQMAVIFNPTTNTLTGAGSGARLTNPRGVVANDGRVIFTAQIGTSGLPPLGTPIYNPTTATWGYTGPIARTRNFPALVALKNGRVLAAGGTDNGGGNPYPDAEIWDPTTGKWSLIEAMPEGHGNPGYGIFSDGSVLVAAGTGAFGAGVSSATVYRPVADGQACGDYPTACDAPYCTDGVCCRSADCPRGTCAAPPGAGRAAGTCALDPGQACTTNAQCASNFCADGVCCNTACTGTCEACNLAGTVGTCTPVTGKPMAPRAACAGAGAGTACAASCNGVNRTACVYAATGTIACGTNSCTGGTETRAGTCNGAGVCNTTTTSCGVYACGAELCKRSCVTDVDCASGYYCGGDKCLPKVGLGSICTSTAMCPSGLFCTDGVCCGVASCSEGSACNLEPKGTCKKKDGASCTIDSDCGSAFCTDGVCCNRKCDAQCEACDLPSTNGTCSPVSGAPRGTRAACGGEGCAALECDGAKDPTACTKFKNGGTVVCKPASCDGADLVPQSTCDGAGSCASPPVAKCGRYACDPARLACRTDCTTNTDCASGFSCVAGTCSEGARCTEDGLSSTSTDGKVQACTPYRCASAGTCLDKCSKTDECAAGFVCGSGICTAAEVPAEDGGGCAASGRSNGAAAGLLFALAALATRRRRSP